MLANKKRSLKYGLSRKMKQLANDRQCPKCLRKSAISSKRDGDWLTQWCRYCDYDTGLWLSNKAFTRQGRAAAHEK